MARDSDVFKESDSDTDGYEEESDSDIDNEEEFDVVYTPFGPKRYPKLPGPNQLKQPSTEYGHEQEFDVVYTPFGPKRYPKLPWPNQLKQPRPDLARESKREYYPHESIKRNVNSYPQESNRNVNSYPQKSKPKRSGRLYGPPCDCFHHRHMGLSDRDLVCPCSYHQERSSPDTNHRSAKGRANSRPTSKVNLSPEEAERSCSLLGCRAVISEINRRCGVSYFSMTNPMIRQSLKLCMVMKLDFGTAYAYFRSVVLAAEVDICTVDSPCQMRNYLITRESRPEVPTYRGDNPDCPRLHCVFQSLPPKARAALTMEHTHEEMKRNGQTSGQNLLYPYNRMPRRMWDLAARRIIMSSIIELAHYSCHLCKVSGKFDAQRASGLFIAKFWAVSHGWLDESKRHFVWTKVNGHQWPVPLPRDANIDSITDEAKSLISQRNKQDKHDEHDDVFSRSARSHASTGTDRSRTSQFHYCWLDILCLRQGWPEESRVIQEKRKEEWKIDVPTIGNLYRCAEGTIRYFNGLGIRMRTDGWEDTRHWLNRAWTLQEMKPEHKTLNGGISRSFYHLPRSGDQNYFSFPLDTLCVVPGRPVTTLSGIIEPLHKIARAAEQKKCSILDLFEEMRRRFASNDRDKVAGINYLLHLDRLPKFQLSEGASESWKKSLRVLPPRVGREMLFNYPHCRGDPVVSWAPAWTDIANAAPYHRLGPVPQPTLPTTDFNIPCGTVSRHMMSFDQALFTAGVLIQTNCYVWENCKLVQAHVRRPGHNPERSSHREYAVWPGQGRNKVAFVTLNPSKALSSFSEQQFSEQQSYTLVTHSPTDLNAGLIVCTTAQPLDHASALKKQLASFNKYEVFKYPAEEIMAVMSDGMWLKKHGVLRRDPELGVQLLPTPLASSTCYFY